MTGGQMKQCASAAWAQRVLGKAGAPRTVAAGIFDNNYEIYLY